MLGRLTRLAEEYNVAVFLTNQVQSDPGASALFASADGRKPYVINNKQTLSITLLF